MKTMVPSALFLVALTLSTLISGCEESNLTSQKRARLVGDENLKLKKQLKLCNLEIQKLKKDFAEYEKELQTSSLKQTEDTSGTLLKMLAGTSKQVQEFTEENKQLRNKIRELESKLTQNTNQQDSQ
jgi:chromosome segregation ATPase